MLVILDSNTHIPLLKTNATQRLGPVNWQVSKIYISCFGPFDIQLRTVDRLRAIDPLRQGRTEHRLVRVRFLFWHLAHTSLFDRCLHVHLVM
jgi:hypothetical protein